MKHIIFEFKDKYTRGEWQKQECYVESRKECINMYGLGVDCEYRIILEEDANDCLCKK